MKNTGNDIKYSSTASPTSMHVWVGDGSFSRLAWDDGTHHGTILLDNGNGNVWDPDVSLVKCSNGNWVAIVVFSTSSNYYCEFYKWDAMSAFVWFNEFTLQSGVYGSAINVDADASGNYVIVWDDGAGNINGSYGTTTTFPTNPTTYTTIIPQNGNDNYSAPDVSIYGSNCYVAYLWTDGSSLYTDIYMDNFDLSLGSQSHWYPQLTYGPFDPAHGYVETPRIACPGSNCANPDFTVVYHWVDTDSSNEHIMGYSYTDYYADKGLSDYTHLDNSPFCTTANYNYDVSNFNPAVTYSSDYDGTMYGGILVAWTNDGSSTHGEIPIAVKCNGAYGMYGFVADCQWYEVPYATGSVQHAISLSGRDYTPSDNIFLTWDKDNLSDVYYKDVPFSGGDLREKNTKDHSQDISGIFPNPTSGNFQIRLGTKLGESVNIEIYNSYGQRVYASLDVSSSENFIKDISLNNFEDGIYLIRATGEQPANNWKLILYK